MEKDQHPCCLCCFLPTLHFLLYVTSTILQWILFAIARADGVECTKDPLLAAAVLSTIATLFTSVDTTCGFAFDSNSDCVENCTPKQRSCTHIIIKLLSYACKITAGILNLVFRADNNQEKCELIAYPFGLLVAIVVLEFGTVLLEVTIKFATYLWKKCGRKSY